MPDYRVEVGGEPGEVVGVEEVVGVLGQEAVLYCPYTGRPPDTMRWSFAGKVLGMACMTCMIKC